MARRNHRAIPRCKPRTVGPQKCCADKSMGVLNPKFTDKW